MDETHMRELYHLHSKFRSKGFPSICVFNDPQQVNQLEITRMIPTIFHDLEKTNPPKCVSNHLFILIVIRLKPPSSPDYLRLRRKEGAPVGLKVR